MINDIYWLWLQKALGQGAVLSPILKHFGDAKEIYNARMTDEIEMSGLFSKKLAMKLRETNTNHLIEIQQTCDENNWKIVTYQDEEYPKVLKSLADPPAVLYISGELPDFENYLTIGVVGARVASKYAERVAHFLSYSIGKSGAIIVSGGAMGVDAMAHNGALSSGGKTVAVLGCGFGTKYLMQNQGMRQRIEKAGALISEYPPFTQALASHFPVRNRLISGLSKGIVVVEANIRSGSLITANRATEQGRDVYAVPGSIISDAYLGTSQLLNQGAGLVLSPLSILEPYIEFFPTLDISKAVTADQWKMEFGGEPLSVPKGYNEKQRFKKEIKNEAKAITLGEIDKEKNLVKERQDAVDNLNEEQLKVYNALTEEYQHIDSIVSKAGANIRNVAVTLTQLELCGLATAASGKRYRKE